MTVIQSETHHSTKFVRATVDFSLDHFMTTFSERAAESFDKPIEAVRMLVMQCIESSPFSLNVSIPSSDGVSVRSVPANSARGKRKGGTGDGAKAYWAMYAAEKGDLEVIVRQRYTQAMESGVNIEPLTKAMVSRLVRAEAGRRWKNYTEEERESYRELAESLGPSDINKRRRTTSTDTTNQHPQQATNSDDSMLDDEDEF